MWKIELVKKTTKPTLGYLTIGEDLLSSLMTALSSRICTSMDFNYRSLMTINTIEHCGQMIFITNMFKGFTKLYHPSFPKSGWIFNLMFLRTQNPRQDILFLKRKAKPPKPKLTANKHRAR